ncbi:MAG: CRISPR-associated protein, partial [Oscillospiraceae bacterium]|nr:CRISPR-associated protein [Oscillospiraceae bacterium]
DTDWTLVATSCVEAGVDFSFRTGFRELGSLTSLLQASGRVNRGGIYPDAEMWTFCLAEGESLKSNPGLKNAAAVLRGYFDKDTAIAPSLVTAAIEREIKLYGMNSTHKKLIKGEDEQDFPYVNDNFKVIDSDTRIAVVDGEAVPAIIDGHADWHYLQQNSLQIAKFKLDELCVPQIANGIYRWTRGYDAFLGYMLGVINANTLARDPLII